MHANDLVAQLRNVLDRDAALALFQGAVRQESITGHERNVVAYLAERMRALGLDSVVSAEFLPGRPNVWGERNGAGGGPRLLFIGHTDTVHVDGWREHWAGTEREDPFAATIVDGAVWGRGAGDLKAGIAPRSRPWRCSTAPASRLPGDVAFAFVGDEESGEPGTGVSAGMKDYVGRHRARRHRRGPISSSMSSRRGWPSIRRRSASSSPISNVTGMSAYFGVPELGHDALKAAHRVLAALWRIPTRLRRRAAHRLVGRGVPARHRHRGRRLHRRAGRGAVLADPQALARRGSRRGARRARSGRARRRVGPRDRASRFAYPAGPRPCARRHRGRDRSATRPEVAMLCADACAAAMAGRGAHRGRAVLVGDRRSSPSASALPAVYCAPGDIRNCHTLEEHVRARRVLRRRARLRRLHRALLRNVE